MELHRSTWELYKYSRCPKFCKILLIRSTVNVSALCAGAAHDDLSGSASTSAAPKVAQTTSQLTEVETVISHIQHGRAANFQITFPDLERRKELSHKITLRSLSKVQARPTAQLGIIDLWGCPCSLPAVAELREHRFSSCLPKG
ncbi:hypothetical protein LshimejAT787_2600120 [Lyophyllum shimeji]|uniref:Uncharacterized protein n=1 Tax=Lyophyllum shimeji TaxID=47721 RepID=A0A9P3Q1X6_LYOSH|nr:hypothetical protein LshimejAT787_2600120 [Lyophyllum shimeji]